MCILQNFLITTHPWCFQKLHPTKNRLPRHHKCATIVGLAVFGHNDMPRRSASLRWDFLFGLGFSVGDLASRDCQIITLQDTITYCWWKKSCTTWHVWNPAINGIFNINWCRISSINSSTWKLMCWNATYLFRAVSFLGIMKPAIIP